MPTQPVAHLSSVLRDAAPADARAVLVFGRPTCLFCVRAKLLLWWRGVPYTWIDVTGRDELRAELLRVTGRKTVPQIFFGERSIGGYTDLAALDRAGELSARVTA